MTASHVESRDGYQSTKYLERFNAKWIGEQNSGCWLWTAACQIDRNGHDTYGVVSRPNKRPGLIIAHRASWLIHHGDLLDGVCVLHRCDVPQCVNPDHLFLGSIADNNADKARKGRAPQGAGHPRAKLTPQQVNVIRQSKGNGSALGKRYGVTRSIICAIRKGHSWRSLPYPSGHVPSWEEKA